MSSLVRAGCIRFDVATQVQSGWASLEGEDAVRFNSLSDLDSNCFFISNMGFQESYKTGLAGSSKIRNTDYFDTLFYSINDREENQKIQNQSIQRLRRSPNDIIAQIGINEDDWPNQAKYCSEVFSRIYELSVLAFDLKSPPFYTLKNGLRNELAGFDSVIDDEKLFNALESSTTHYSLAQRPVDAIDTEVDYGIGLAVPKVAHALEILSKPLPKINTKWKFLSRKIKTTDVPSYLDSVNPNGCYLFRVNFKSFDDVYAPIVNFGTGKESRVWITGAEALFFKDKAVFEIYQGFEAEDVMPFAPYYEELKEAFGPEQHDLSYSAGLFLQNIWTALAKSRPPPANIKKQNESFNSFMPFLKAYDRLILTEKARELGDLDITVTSYSKSELRAVLRDTQVNQDVYEAFKKVGLMPYGLKINMEGYEVGGKPIDILRKIYMEGDTQSILMLDRKFYKPKEFESEELEHVG